MNVIFFTQSNTLNLYYQVYLRLKRRGLAGRCAFYIANLWNYNKFLLEYPDFEKEVTVLKEWEIYKEADQINKPDLALISKYEKEIGDPTLWGPLVTDRRLYCGRKTTFFQDYKPSFSHKQMLKVLQVALPKISSLFEEVKPDFIATLYTATFGDCIAHLYAKAKGIKSYDLRLSRIKNYVMFVDNVCEPPPHIQNIYNKFQIHGVPDALKSEALEYISTVREKTAKYEGVLSANKNKTLERQGFFKLGYKYLRKLAVDIRHRSFTKTIDRYDPQNFKGGEKYFYRECLNKINSRKIYRCLQDDFFKEEDANNYEYALYALHTEPELVLAQFARPYLNQVEVIRNIALSLPVHMKLVVKEHPLMLGRRPLSYYKKILDIPNVVIADLFMPSEIAVKQAKIFVGIRGAMSMEAIIKGIPVVALGRTAFEIYNGSNFAFVKSLYDLPCKINELLKKDNKIDDDKILLLVSSIIAGSESINLLTDLLKKAGRFRAAEGVDVPFEEHPHLDKLTDYLLKRYNDEGF